MYGIGIFELIILAGILLVPALLAVAIVVVLAARGSFHRNLTPCPDCRRLISVRAERCPHCGCRPGP